MPTDRDKFDAQAWLNGSRPDFNDATTLSEVIATARAEGFREGLERAAEWCDRRGVLADSPMARAAAAIRALAPVPDSQPNLAKATDPRGSEGSGVGDATAVDELFALRAKVRTWHDCIKAFGWNVPGMLRQMRDAAVPLGEITEADQEWARRALAESNATNTRDDQHYYRGVAVLPPAELEPSAPHSGSTPATGGLLSPDSASGATGATLPPTETTR